MILKFFYNCLMALKNFVGAAMRLGTRKLRKSLPAPIKHFVRINMLEFQGVSAKANNSLEQVQSRSIKCKCDANHVSTSHVFEKPIVFLFDPRSNDAGSAIARHQQSQVRLASITSSPIFQYGTIGSKKVDIHDSIVVVTKSARTHTSVIRELLSDGNYLLADYVDASNVEQLDEMVHGFICSSYTEFAFLQKNLPEKKSFLVPHAIDDRLYGMTNSSESFSCGYFGNESNALFGQKLSDCDLMDFYVQSNDTTTNDWVTSLKKSMESYSAQYIIRPPLDSKQTRMFKPFNKGFLTAYAGSIVIGSKIDQEHVYWLGRDYPFLANSNSWEDVSGIIDFARSSYGNNQWVAATKTMRSLRAKSCPIVNANDYASALKGLTQ